MLHFQAYNDINQVPVTADQFLERDAAVNNILLGNLNRMRGQHDFFQDYHIFLVDDQNAIQLYAQHIPPHPLFLSCGNEPAVEILATSLRERSHAFSRLHGPSALVEVFAKSWPELFQKETHRERQGLYKLEQVIFPQASGAKFDRATLAELDLMVAWQKAFIEELGDTVVSEAEITEIQTRRIQAADLFVLREGSRAVSMGAATRTLGQGRAVSFIYTPPELRGRGYASELTAFISDHILKSGFTFCCLFTQMHNPTSNKIYQNIGYTRVQEFLLVEF